jgi:hypothetical protein
VPRNQDNSAGGSGTATGTSDWETGNITLSPGENIITVSGGVQQTDSVNITYNLTVDFQSAPTLSENKIEADVAETLLVTIAIDSDQLDENTVALYQSDKTGTKGAKLADLKDDGDFGGPSGDDVIGDNIYTAKLTVDEPTSKALYYRVYADDYVGDEYASSIAILYVISKPTDEMVQNAASNAKDIDDMWTTLEPTANLQVMAEAEYRAAFSDAQDNLVSHIAQMPNNLFVYKGTNGVFYAMDDAPFIMLQETIPDLSVYENEIDGAAPRGLPAEINHTRAPVFFGSQDNNGIRAIALADEDDKNVIKEKKAIFIDPYYWQHVNSTKMSDDNGGWTAIEEATCPDLDETEVLNGTDASTNVDPKTKDTAIIDAFTTLSNYGTVVIHTHGAYWDYGQSNWVTELETTINNLPDDLVKFMLQIWLENQKDSVLSWTGKKLLYASDVFMDIDYASVSGHKYWEDFLTGSLYLGNNGKIYIPPAFIKEHNGAFPNSIIWSGACHSLQDESMSSMFIAKGAGAYFGFDESVYRTWNVSRAGVVFNKMLDEGQSAKEAFDAAVAAGNDDGHGTKLVLKGNNDLKYEPKLQNPSFEDPEGAGSLQSWTVIGDARVWKTFQADVPTDGSTMAVVSSGLGHTTEYGEFAQKFCLPADAKSITFDWNFYSAEFKDFCDSSFDDTFQVTIDYVEVFKTSVNILCANQDALIETQPIDDHGDCFKTGWINTSVDVSGYAGEDVTLTFSVLDKGDTIYDTATLVDNIVIETE